MATIRTKIGTIGTCPVCEGQYHVQKGLMVNHGFLRPGDGMLHGICWGVAHIPFEISCDATKSYRVSVEKSRGTAKQHLADLQDGRIAKMERDETEYELKLYFGRRERVAKGPIKYETYTSTETDPHRQAIWSSLLQNEVSATKRKIQMFDMELERVDALIAKWTPKPLREVTDQTIALEKAEKDARKAARTAKTAAANAAYKAKRLAEEAKTKAEQEREDNFYAVWAVKFAEVTSSSEPIETRKAKAFALVAEMRKAIKIEKFRHNEKDYVSTPWKLKQGPALAALGLARHVGADIYEYRGFGWGY